MPDETLEGWLAKEIADAQNVYDMYRSYRQSDSRAAMVTLSRLHAFEEVRSKIGELWGTLGAGQGSLDPPKAAR